MCASLLDTVIGQNMREFIKYHSSVQHILGVVFLVFTIGVITSHKTIFVFMYSLCVYAWFLVVSKLPGEWNMIILTPLMACFILSALLHREAIDEWEGSELDRSIKRKRMLSAIDILGWIILTLSVGFALWFVSPHRKKIVHTYLETLQNNASEFPTEVQRHFQKREMEKKASSRINIKDTFFQFMYQPFAYPVHTLLEFFSVRPYDISEKYNIQHIEFLRSLFSHQKLLNSKDGFSRRS